MIEVNGQKFKRKYSLNTPTKQLVVAEGQEDETFILVVYKDNYSKYAVLGSFYDVTSAIEFCKDINEKLKLIHRARKAENDIPFELRMF